MSACPATLLPPLNIKIRAFCRFGLSCYQRVLGLPRHSERAIFALILVETVGAYPVETWAEFSDEDLEQAANVSRKHALDALQALIDFGYVRSRKNARGRREYSIADVFHTELKAEKIHGQCPHCKDIVPIESRWFPFPHIVLRKLPACLDACSYACLLVILRYCLQYSREHGVCATIQQLEINDFVRETDYDPRSIKLALKKLCDPKGWALVERSQRSGRPSRYLPSLDNLYKLDRREARVVVMPERGERSAKSHGVKCSDSPETTAKTSEKESPLGVIGYCKKCDLVFTCEPVPEEEIRHVAKQSAPRAGPKLVNGRDPAIAPGEVWRGFDD